MKLILPALSLLLGLISPWANANAPSQRTTTLVFAMPETSYASMQGLWVEAIYREVFKQLGMDIKIVPLPTKRASALLNNGEFDGEVHRSIHYSTDHPNLVRARLPHFAASFAAYGLHPQLRLERGWDSFNASQLKVDTMLGSVTATRELGQRLPAEHLSELTTIEQGLMKLVAGRTDVLVALDQTVDPVLELPKYAHSGITKLGVMEKVDGYLYLQKKHAALLPKVGQIIERMQKEGRIDLLGVEARLQWKAHQH